MMNKKLGFLTTLLLTIGLTALGQIPTCKSLHTGSFKIYTKETGTTFINRTEKYQVEKNEFLGYEVVFEITWTDDCTYELRPKKVIMGDPAIMGDGTLMIKSIIKKISINNYIAETSVNFNSVV